MDFAMLASWVVVGLLAGWLARFAMKGAGNGRIADLLVGLVGSIVGGGVVRALDVAPAGRIFPTVLFAFVGAVILIVAERAVSGVIRLRG
jgi:uncharacterized membrane protein YeaQ/YmgE (transglycosylase-associated protein family)